MHSVTRLCHTDLWQSQSTYMVVTDMVHHASRLSCLSSTMHQRHVSYMSHSHVYVTVTHISDIYYCRCGVSLIHVPLIYARVNPRIWWWWIMTRRMKECRRRQVSCRLSYGTQKPSPPAPSSCSTPCTVMRVMQERQVSNAMPLSLRGVRGS